MGGEIYYLYLKNIKNDTGLISVMKKCTLLGGAMKSEIQTHRQHYIPKNLILKRFVDEKNQIQAYNIESDSFFTTNPNNLFVERDLYEFRDLDGQILLPNATENLYANIECFLAGMLDELLESINNATDNILPVENEACMTMIIAMLSVRHPDKRKLFRGKDDEGIFKLINELHYQHSIVGGGHVNKFIKELNIPDEISQAFEGQSPFEYFTSWLLNNCWFSAGIIKGDRCFYLSDSPVLILNGIDIKYALPVSSKICMYVSEMNNDKYKGACQIIEATDDTIDKINEKSVLNSKKIIASQGYSEKDKIFIRDVLSKVES